jgi:hypothetical protein
MPPTNCSYRSLEHLYRRQAALSSNAGAKRELDKMAREYEQMADWQDRNHEPEE